MKLSILICTIPRRFPLLSRLVTVLQNQIADYRKVEVLYLGDNKRRSIGEKRNALLSVARGDFFAFIDDDDMVTGDYVPRILAAIANDPDADVIVFDTVTHQPHKGTHKRNKVGIEYGRTETADLVTCPPTHTMVWRRSLIVSEWKGGDTWAGQAKLFKDMSQGEDVDWVDRVAPLVKKQVRIDAVLYHYNYDPKVSERP